MYHGLYRVVLTSKTVVSLLLSLCDVRSAIAVCISLTVTYALLLLLMLGEGSGRPYYTLCRLVE